MSPPGRNRMMEYGAAGKRAFSPTRRDGWGKFAPSASPFGRQLARLCSKNDRVLPFFEEQNVPLLRVLTDRGTEYCGQREHHEYQLYVAVENIDHTRTKARHPQTNGICERFHRTIQEEFYATAFRKKLFQSLDELQ